MAKIILCAYICENYIQNECPLKVNNKITNSTFFKGKNTHDGVNRFEFNIK